MAPLTTASVLGFSELFYHRTPTQKHPVLGFRLQAVWLPSTPPPRPPPDILAKTTGVQHHSSCCLRRF